MVQAILEIIQSNAGQALIIAALTAIAGWLLRPRGKLVWSVSHQHYYSVPRVGEEGSFPVRTQQIWIQNLGRKAIEDVEIVLNWKPQHYEIWNPRHYSQGTLPDGRHSIRFPNLSSQEFFTLSILDTFNELPIVVAIRWKEGLGKPIRMSPQLLPSKWALWLFWAMVLIGITTVLYLALQAILYVSVLITP
ncbi:hypothetical protein FHW02_003978 [Ochrobactrum sp. RH1CCR137]|nr:MULTISPECIES: hypothetical protein [unclassified Ochrobactrum]MBA8845891.1 hypothetical protein [Ochrobactrum sp. RH1CCR137]MBA8857613.1 hypothetical protein [Ochrobactrum sp. RH1CCR134]